MDENSLRLIAAVAGASCFAIVFRTPRRYFLQTVLVGATAPIAMHAMPRIWHVGFSTFIVALLIGCLSQIVARITKAPAQCFLIPGVMFLVPGTYVYRAFSAALEKNLSLAMDLFLSAVMITSGVSLGLLIANWLVPPRRTSL